MGGFTTIYLKDNGQENIDLQNKRLDDLGLKQNIRFYSQNDTLLEYEFWRDNPEKHSTNYQPSFPHNKIKTYEDFKRIWSAEYYGEVFIPYIGSLSIDCYFSRSSKRTMSILARYIYLYASELKGYSGSFDTFLERGASGKRSKSIYEYFKLNNIHKLSDSEKG